MSGPLFLMRELSTLSTTAKWPLREASRRSCSLPIVSRMTSNQEVVRRGDEEEKLVGKEPLELSMDDVVTCEMISGIHDDCTGLS